MRPRRLITDYNNLLTTLVDTHLTTRHTQDMLVNYKRGTFISHIFRFFIGGELLGVAICNKVVPVLGGEQVK